MEKRIFRGKTPTDYKEGIYGEWKEGFYTCFNGEEHRIYSGYAETDCGDYYPDWWSVVPETVGQCTGKTDKNGKKIFEGDIFKPFDNEIVVVSWIECYSTLGLVVYITDTVKKKGKEITKTIQGTALLCDYNLDKNEIIGNIHDNPELLKGGADNG